MKQRLNQIPLIDIFAGPGGLSEGFHSTSEAGLDFKNVLSIEKDAVACETLRLRRFFHQFKNRRVPEAYYNVVRGEKPISSLFNYPEWSAADLTVWNAELGKMPVKDLHARIQTSINGRTDWVLLGGPPCQAYSLVGRSRMTGIGHTARTSEEGITGAAKLRRDKITVFSKDIRHQLYREYLRIVAVHQPAVFVMENVKGILSSKIHNDDMAEAVFTKIRTDLASPWKALTGDPALSEISKFRKAAPRDYRLYSLVVSAVDAPISDKDFLIKCEYFGVPQARHRVVILGVREDLHGRPQVLRPRSKASVRDVIGSMPSIRSGLSKEEDTSKSWLNALRQCFTRNARAKLTDKAVKKTISKVVGRSYVRLNRGSKFFRSEMPAVQNSKILQRWLTDVRLGGVIQHESRSHMNSDLGRYLFASATASRAKRSPRLTEWPKYLLPKHKNVDPYRSKKSTDSGVFVDRFKVQVWERPSSTVTSHIAKDGHYFIHPDPFQCRSLTVREAARLQTFPDNYFFCGNRTQQYHQVGNAVPPFLASQIADVVAIFLAANSPSRDS